MKIQKDYYTKEFKFRLQIIIVFDIPSRSNKGTENFGILFVKDDVMI